MTEFVCGAKPLSVSGLHDACEAAGVKAAEIWSVVFTETDPPYGGFWPSALPQILYEQHVFHRLTNGRFDQSNPDISSPHSGNYGASGSHQYARLLQAATSDASAALQSASWGIGQTLGENYKMCGYASVQDLVTDMFDSEDKQLMAAVKEMIASGCAKALRNHDWTGFARIYNGAGYAKNQYDTKLRGWYTSLSGGTIPDLDLRAAQVYLVFLGYHPGSTDGLWGHRTADALNTYQRDKKLPLTDEVDAGIVERLRKEAEAKIATVAPIIVAPAPLIAGADTTKAPG